MRPEEVVVVGVSHYTIEEGTEVDLLYVDEEVWERQLARLEEVKADHDNSAVADALNGLNVAIESDENVMPAIVDAVKAYATMGEIMQMFEDHYGSYQETPIAS